MNIFYVSHNPTECAAYLDDGRLVKMILETAQLLSTALTEWGQEIPEGAPKATHRNHPCAVWVRDSIENYDWTCMLLTNLCLEYQHRYGKAHKYNRLPLLYYWDVERNAVPTNGTGTQSVPPNCTVYKDEENTIAAYRKYLIYKWNDAMKRGLHHRFYSARVTTGRH